MLILEENTVYRVAGGTKKKLGDAEPIFKILDSVYLIGKDVYTLEGKKLSLLVSDCEVYRILWAGNMPQIILGLKNAQKKNVPTPDLLLWADYLKMKGDDTSSATIEVCNKGVVIRTSEGMRLYIVGRGFVPDEELVKLEDGRTFIYKGMTCVISDDSFGVRFDFEPIYKGQNYLLFSGGKDVVFALMKEEGKTAIKTLGRVLKVIETNVSRLLLVETNDGYALWCLAEDCQLIEAFDGIQDYHVEDRTGAVVIYHNDGTEACYTYSNDAYQRLL